MKIERYAGHRDFAQVELINDRLIAMRRGAHTRAARGVVAGRAMWFGLAIAGSATVVLGLYSIYRLLSGVFIGTAAPPATGLAIALLGALGFGVGLSLAAFLALVLQSRRQRAQHTAKTETTIAA